MRKNKLPRVKNSRFSASKLFGSSVSYELSRKYVFPSLHPRINKPRFSRSKNKNIIKSIGDIEFLKVKIDFWFIAFLFISFAFLYSALAVIRHNHFQSQGIDFSIYDQALWLYSQLEKPHSTITNLLDLADRFRPIMIPLSLLYFFTDNERVILLFQAVFLSASVFPIWLIARQNLPRIMAVVVSLIYLDFIGIQSASVYDFHEMSMLPFFLAWLFYFLIKRKWNFYFLFLFLSLSVREHVGFLLSTLGIYIFLIKRDVKVATMTTIISLFWSILAVRVIMPALGQGGYESFLQKGDTLETAMLEYLSNPHLAINNFFFPYQKTQTLFWSFFSFGLMPLIYLPLLPAILYQFASRFLDQLHPIRWTLFFHYSAELAVLMSISTIFATKIVLGQLRHLKYAVIIVTVLLLVTHLFTNSVLNSPLKLILNPEFYKHKSWMDNTSVVLTKIPQNASVAAQNNLLPHLSHRREIYLLPKVNNAEYIIIDLHSGQNDWNFYTENLESTKALVKHLVVSNLYKPIVSSGDTYLFRRVEKY